MLKKIIDKATHGNYLLQLQQLLKVALSRKIRIKVKMKRCGRGVVEKKSLKLLNTAITAITS